MMIGTGTFVEGLVTMDARFGCRAITKGEIYVVRDCREARMPGSPHILLGPCDGCGDQGGMAITLEGDPGPDWIQARAGHRLFWCPRCEIRPIYNRDAEFLEKLRASIKEEELA